MSKKDLAYLAIDLGIIGFIGAICIALISRFTIGGWLACCVAQVLFYFLFAEKVDRDRE